MLPTVLYSFRRCPYAIRTRMVLKLCNIECQVREVELKNKPLALRQASPKGTVPVLVLDDGKVLEESLDIIDWALKQTDNDAIGTYLNVHNDPLIAENDGSFKTQLDVYKYADRHPENSQAYYLEQSLGFIEKLDKSIASRPFLMGENLSVVDVVIFPFIRQFKFVDPAMFDELPYPNLQRWLDYFLSSSMFTTIMPKIKPWQNADEPVYLCGLSKENDK